MSKAKIAFFDAKDYDTASFDEANKDGKFTIKYFDTKLTKDTVKLAKGYDAVCVFVNDTVDKKVIDALVKKGVKLVITNSASMVVAPDYFCIYRSEKDGTKKFCVAKIPATSINASGTTQFVDKCEILANTYTAFMGEFTPEVIAFKQLAPIMKMDLALLGPAYRWMILLYGVPQLYAPKKWMKFINIKASSDRTSSTALYNN